MRIFKFFAILCGFVAVAWAPIEIGRYWITQSDGSENVGSASAHADTASDSAPRVIPMAKPATDAAAPHARALPKVSVNTPRAKAAPPEIEASAVQSVQQPEVTPPREYRGRGYRKRERYKRHASRKRSRAAQTARRAYGPPRDYAPPRVYARPQEYARQPVFFFD